MQHAEIIDRPTARQCLSRPYGGGADAAGTGAGASYLPGKYVMNAQRLPSQLHQVRIQQAGGPNLQNGGATMAHYSDQARATRAEMTESLTSVSNVRAPVASGIAPPSDVARATRAEFSESQVQRPVFYGQQAPTVQFMDVARPTMLEGTEQMVRQTNINNGIYAPTVQFMDPQKATMKEFSEQQVRQSNMNNGIYAPTVRYMDEQKATMAEFTEQQVRQANMNNGIYAPTVRSTFGVSRATP